MTWSWSEGHNLNEKGRRAVGCAAGKEMEEQNRAPDPLPGSEDSREGEGGRAAGERLPAEKAAPAQPPWQS